MGEVLGELTDSRSFLLVDEGLRVQDQSIGNLYLVKVRACFLIQRQDLSSVFTQ